MLYLPDIEYEPHERIVSFDPGTGSLGIAVLDYNAENKTHVVEYAATAPIDKQYRKQLLLIEKFGDRIAKLQTVKEVVSSILNYWEPSLVASEAPYMGRFPQAYAALVECVDAIRKGTNEYDIFMPLKTIDPATVKKTLGVSGKSGDKTLILKALEKREDLLFKEGVNLHSLDEHALDAIAVGIAASYRLPPWS